MRLELRQRPVPIASSRPLAPRAWVAAPLLALALTGGCNERSENDTAPVAAALGRIIATCSATEGRVEALSGGSTYWEPISSGAVFRSGDWARTGLLSYARIEFTRGGRVELDENSVVFIEIPRDLPSGGEAPPVLAVQSGSLRGKADPTVRELRAPLMFKTSEGKTVQLTPRRGGEPVEFRVDTNAGRTEFVVTRGQANLTVGASTHALSAGQGAALANDGAIETFELLDYPPSVSPGIDARFAAANDLSIALSWREVAGARSYRVEVARDLSFTQRVASADVEATSFAFRPPHGPGEYAWRVAARDKQGRLGEEGFARRIYVEESTGGRELLVGPAPGAEVFAGDAVTFTWQSLGGKAEYELVLSQEDDLSMPVLRRTTSAQVQQVKDLREGEYFWGVYSTRGERLPLFATTRLLVVRPAKARAQIQAPAKIDDWGN